MKLRIRSMETKETLKIDAPNISTLMDLKTLIASKLSPPIPPDSIHLSLNRTQELLSPSPADPLPFLGLTSGDLLFFTLAHAPQTLTLAPHSIGSSTPMDETLESNPNPSSPTEGDLMDDVRPEPEPIKKPPSFLKRALEAENWEARGDLGRLVVAVHAVFIESGFVVPWGHGYHLPADWASAPTVSVLYTLPDLQGNRDEEAKIATLKFSAMGKKYVSVYGFVSCASPDIHRVCLVDVPELGLAVDEMSKMEEKDVFRLWKIVRDGLVLPLLIDLCDKNGLPLPPCFTSLPTDLKMKILELLSGVDIAMAGCTSSELRYISSNNELWKQKFKEEFQLLDSNASVGRNWKKKFATCWSNIQNANKRTGEYSGIFYGMPNEFGPMRIPFAPQMFPGIIGGDYDMFPAIGGIDPLGLRIGFPHLPGRRNFSPQCNLGGRDSSFPM